MSQRGEKNWDNKTEREREEKRKVPQNTKSGKTKEKRKIPSFTINFTSEHNLKKKTEAKRRKRLKLHRNPLNVVEKLYRPNNYDHRAPKPCFILGTHKGSRKRVKFTGFTCGGGGDWCTPCYFVPRNWRVNAESRRKTGWKRKRLANRNSSQFICQLKLQLVFQPRCIRGSQFFPSFVALHFAFFIFFSFLFTFFPSPLLISIPRFRDRRRRPTLSSSILDFLRYHPWRLLSILFSVSSSLSLIFLPVGPWTNFPLDIKVDFSITARIHLEKFHSFSKIRRFPSIFIRSICVPPAYSRRYEAIVRRLNWSFSREIKHFWYF